MRFKKASFTSEFAAFCLVAAMLLFMGCSDGLSSGSPKLPSGEPVQSTGDPYAGNSTANIKNVILMIPDGTSYEAMKVVDYYLNGTAESQIFNNFPVQVGVETSEYEYIYEYTYDPEDPTAVTGYTITGYIYLGYDPDEAWSDFNYMIWMDPLLDYFAHYPYVNNTTDSASASTAIATGYKTRDGSIGYGVIADTMVDSTAEDADFVSLTNITQIAKQLGKAAGVVSSVPFSHATGAGQVAHNPSRNDYFGIADEMIFDSGIEVIMGPGLMDYEYNGTPRVPPRVGNRISNATINTVTDWYNNGPVDGGFTVVRSRTEFQTLGSSANPPQRVLGIPNVRETLQYYRGTNYMNSYYTPFTDRTETVPTLGEMAKGALNVLRQYDNGFFLMVEGGAVDWANHFGVLYRAEDERGPTPGPWGVMVEEMDEFNKAVEAAYAWVEQNSNWNETLLIVVPDHDTGFVWGPGSMQGDDGPVFNEVVNNGAGNLPGFNWYTWWHSNMLVPLYAKGACAERFTEYVKGTDPRYGDYIDNIDIFKVMHYGFLKNALAGLIAQARSLNMDYGLVSRLLAADSALDRRAVKLASVHLDSFSNEVTNQGMADKARDMVDAIEPHVDNTGW